MKVIHIMDNLGGTGGVNNFVYDLCCALKLQNVDVSLIGILDSKDAYAIQKLGECGIEVVCLEAKSKKEAILHFIYALRKEIVRLSGGKPTICNLHLKLGVLMGGIATLGLDNVKCVETYHSQYKNYTLEYNLMKCRISGYIPCSQSAAKEMKKRFHVPKEKVHMIPNGINLMNVKESFLQKEADGHIVFLSVGRLTKQKNYSVLIDAFNALDLKAVDYHIIGEGEDENCLKERAVSPNIHFIGAMGRTEVLNYTAEADIICMPSLWEGLSIYMMEAFALGKPMILSDNQSFREAVEEEELRVEHYRKCKWGYLVKVDDVQAYEQVIMDFIEHPEEWSSMAEASFKLAKRFDIQSTAEKYREVYTKLLCGGKCDIRGEK